MSGPEQAKVTLLSSPVDVGIRRRPEAAVGRLRFCVRVPGDYAVHWLFDVDPIIQRVLPVLRVEHFFDGRGSQRHQSRRVIYVEQ